MKGRRDLKIDGAGKAGGVGVGVAGAGYGGGGPDWAGDGKEQEEIGTDSRPA